MKMFVNQNAGMHSALGRQAKKQIHIDFRKIETLQFERVNTVRNISVKCTNLKVQSNASNSEIVLGEKTQLGNGVVEGFLTWRGYQIRYQQFGNSGPPVILVHGFGANCDHWRKNITHLGKTCRTVSVDLLGYGYSDKPSPTSLPPNSLYTFDTWADQILDIADHFFGEPAFFISNSIGGIVTLQAATRSPEKVAALQIQNVSLRKLHIENQPALARPFIRAFQNFLRETAAGKVFFGQIAKPDSVKQVLQQAYHNPETVTDELVEYILKPGLQEGAVEVFLDFVSYSGGPLPQKLLQGVEVPVCMVWGDRDPWEKVEWGRQLAQIESVSEYIELPGLGHCPHDEGPEVVNPIMTNFVEKYSGQLRAQAA